MPRESSRSRSPSLGRRSLCRGALATALLGACDGPARPSRFLVLGGTNFVGPPIVEVLRARGLEVTLFNRGRTNPGLFADLEQLRGDRATGDLTALRGRIWDAVIDISGVVPSWVEASARLLAPVVDRYVLISSTSVYQRFDLGPADESTPLRPDPRRLDDPSARYGERKAACERRASAAAPGRTCVIRSTFVVGPGDPGDRMQAWLARAAEGGPLVAPGGPDRRLLFVDRRDLARFVAQAVEYRAVGPYNITQRASIAELLREAAMITGSAIVPGYVDDEVLAVARPPVDFPLYVAVREGSRRFPELVVSRALRAGLRLRSPAETLAEIWRSLGGDAGREARLRARGRWPSAARELELRAPCPWQDDGVCDAVSTNSGAPGTGRCRFDSADCED